MFSLWKFISLSLLGLSFSGSKAFAEYTCPNNLDQKPLIKEHLLIHEQSKSFYEISQHNLDVTILINNDDSKVVLNSPNPANVPEIVVTNISTKAICVYPRFSNTNIKNVKKVNITKHLATQAELEIAKRLHQAAIHWHMKDEQSRLTAISLLTDTDEIQASTNLYQLSLISAMSAQLARFQLHKLEDLAAKIHQQTSYLSIPYIADWILAEANIRSNHYFKGIRYLHTAIEKVTNLPAAKSTHRKNLLEIYNLLGDAYLITNQLVKGKQYILKAQELAANDPQTLASIHDNLAYIELTQAKNSAPTERHTFWQKALQQEFQALGYAHQARDIDKQILIHNNIASIYRRAWRLGSALKHYLIALYQLQDRDDPKRKTLITRALGKVYLDLGYIQKAQQYLTKTKTMATLTTPILAAKDKCALGTILRMQNQLQQSINEHLACIAQLRSEDAGLQDLADAHIALFKGKLAQGQTVNYQQHFSHLSNQTLEKLGAMDTLTELNILLSNFYISEGEFKLAEESANSAIDFSKLALNPILGVDALVNMQHILTNLGKHQQALKFGFSALDKIEQVSQQLSQIELGPRWSNITHSVYNGIIEILIQQAISNPTTAAIHKAFETVERSRSIYLRNVLSQRKRNLDLSVETLDSFNSISLMAENTASSKSSNQHLPFDYYLKQDLLRIQTEAAHENLTLREITAFNEQKNTLINTTPNASQAMHSTEIQNLMAANQTALMYQVLNNSVYVFIVTKQHIELVLLGPTDDISNQVENIAKHLKITEQNPAPLLKKLSALLLPELNAQQSTKQLLIMPHKMLHQLPFNALDLEPKAQNYSPLISRFEVKVAPSFSTYFMHPSSNQLDYEVELAVLADPNFNGEELTTDLQSGRQDNDLRNWSKTLRPLPWTAAEALHLQQLYQEQNVLVYTKEQAHKTHLISSKVRNARILHLATHGYFNSKLPENVGFALSPINQRGKQTSGFVTLTELFNYSFNNQLVVISGCDTAMGEQLNGEGMQGLSRAFISQGVQNVIATQWPVSDRASAAFMKAFHIQLKQYGSISQALRQAQLTLQKNPRYRHPFYWAAYIHFSVEGNTNKKQNLGT